MPLGPVVARGLMCTGLSTLNQGSHVATLLIALGVSEAYVNLHSKKSSICLEVPARETQLPAAIPGISVIIQLGIVVNIRQCQLKSEAEERCTEDVAYHCGRYGRPTRYRRRATSDKETLVPSTTKTRILSSCQPARELSEIACLHAPVLRPEIQLAHLSKFI